MTPLTDDEVEQPTPSRRLVRERVMQALYAWEIGHTVGGESIDYLATNIVYPEFRQNAELLDFAQKLMRRTFNCSTECDEIIKSLSENWDFHRIAPVDKVLLRMGIAELLHFPRCQISQNARGRILAERHQQNGALVDAFIVHRRRPIP